MNLFVMGKDSRQAEVCWKVIKHKFKSVPKRVRFVSNDTRLLDGLNPGTMVLVLVGEYQENKAYESWHYRFFKDNGALIIDMSDSTERREGFT